jgi:hypothetical protein
MFNTVLTNGFSGDACLAPDGSILAIGSDSSGNLMFAKVTDGTQISQWDAILNGTGTIITTAAAGWQNNNTNITGGSGGFHLNASIAVSEYIGGTYTIDIYYIISFGSLYYVGCSRSTNGGVSFTYEGGAPTISISDTIVAPIQVAAGKPIYNPTTQQTSATVFCLVGQGTPALSSGFPNNIQYLYAANGNPTSGSWVSWSLPVGYTQPFPNIINDWVLHSFDVEYHNGVYYIVFSGYHAAMAATNPGSGFTASSTQNQFFGNFGLYMTELRQITDSFGSTPGPIYTEPREILEFNSSSITNLNQALYPSLNYDGTYLWLAYRLDTTSSVSEAGAVSQTTNYYLSKSKDFKNFDYQTAIFDSSGNSITSPGVYANNGLCKYAFVGNQNGYYYFWGDGALWQFVQNNVVADVSSDILGIQIQDQTGGASSLNLTLANGTGKWAGTSPTGVGYQAIWKNGAANKNSKIYLSLGYYTSTGGPEYAPRNVFYIQDITQSLTSTTNDLVIVGQDWNKLLTSTQTAYTYTYLGPDFYVDPFSASSIQNWNQVTGTWVQTTPANNYISSSFPGNVFVPYTTYTNVGTAGAYAPVYTTALEAGTASVPALATLATLSGYSITKPEVTMSCTFYLPNTQLTENSVDFYPWYLNSENFIRVEMRQIGNGGGGTTDSLIRCDQLWNGQGSSAQSNAIQGTAGWFTIYIRLSNYGANLDVLVEESTGTGNGLSDFAWYPSNNQALVLNWATKMPYNTYCNLPGQLATIAIGTSGVWGTDSGGHNTPPTIWTAFYNLKFTQNAHSQSIGELTESLGTLAHIFNYLPEQDYVQDFDLATGWSVGGSGAVSFPNRTLSLTSQASALLASERYSDGQIEFDAAVAIPSADVGVENYGFDFIFRSQAQDLTNCYKIRVMNSSNYGSGYLVKASLLMSYTGGGGGVDIPLYSSIIPDNLPRASYGGANNLNIDLTQLNHYQIAFNQEWIYLFINGIEVLSWNDNNTINTFSSGYWGFSTVNNGTYYDYAFNANQVLTVQNVKFPTFWQQNPTFALNPGDDLSSAIQQNLQTVNGWNFSDLGGRMKLITLKTTDAISYYYGDGATNYLLYSVSSDSSDKEYYNQVLVVGDGVSYLATNNTSVGTNGVLREEVIVDYTITTLAAATTRANQELASVQQYGAQPAPQLNINVGSEVFDAVNIVSNSTNTAMGLNGNYRVYTQSFNIDNQSNYNITLGTGRITSNS